MAYLPYHKLPCSGSCILLLLTFVGSFLLLPCPSSRTTESPSSGRQLIYFCPGNDTYASSSSYRMNLEDLLDNMTLESYNTGFYEGNVSDDNQSVYGSYLCRGDLTLKNCSECVQKAKIRMIPWCPDKKGAKIWYDKCILQYSNQSFFGQFQQDYMTWCSYGLITDHQVAQVKEVLSDNLTKVGKQAAGDPTPHRKFATMKFNITVNLTLYMLAQCVPDITKEDCVECFKFGIDSDLPYWCKGQGGQTVSSSCRIRYELYPFYADAPTPAPAHPLVTAPEPPPSGPFSHTEKVHRGRRSSRILEIVGIPTSVVMLLVLGAWCYKRKKAQKDLKDIESEGAFIAKFKSSWTSQKGRFPPCVWKKHNHKESNCWHGDRRTSFLKLERSASRK